LAYEALIHQQLTAGGTIQSPDQMEERALAGAAGPHDDSKLSPRYVQRDAVESDDFVVTLPVNFSNVDATDHAVRCSRNAHDQRDMERGAFFVSLLDGLELGNIFHRRSNEGLDVNAKVNRRIG